MWRLELQGTRPFLELEHALARPALVPETGSRYMEELAFEVVSEQNKRDVREKATRMHRRDLRSK